MATYKGKEGSVTFAAGVVGEVKSFNVNSEVEILDTTAMGDDWETKDGGVGRWTAQVTAHLDYDDVAQKAMIDDIMVAAPTGEAIACEFLIATGKLFGGNAIVQSVGITQQLGAIVEVAISLVGTGALTPTWA